MDDGWVSVGTSWVGVAASVVLLDGLVLEVDTVLEVLVEDEVDEDEDEDEDVSLEVAEEDVVLVPVSEAFKTRQFSIYPRCRFHSCRTHRARSKRH